MVAIFEDLDHLYKLCSSCQNGLHIKFDFGQAVKEKILGNDGHNGSGQGKTTDGVNVFNGH